MTRPIITAVIQDIAFGGAGVARSDGRVVFIPFTMTGELVEAEIVAERKDFAEGRLLRVINPSPDRVTPPCPHHALCGGCAYQHVSYPGQLLIKQEQVRQTLARLGQVTCPVMPCVPSPQPLGYRNRITVHALDGDVGFFGAGSRAIVPIERCLLASEPVNQALTQLRRRRPAEGHFTLREDLRARTFRQTNDAVAELLAQAVGEALPEHGPLLIDAYCGAGFFLKRFTNRFDQLTGLEWSAPAVARAREDAAPHETYLAGDVALHLPEVLENQRPGTALLLDPPAEGLSAGVIRAILKNPPTHLLHISCNPSTLARDLRKLAPAYEAVRAIPFDMFPQTAEIEVLAILQRKP